MRKFGHYVTVHELQRTGLTAVYSGHDDKSPEDNFAIKVREANVLFTDKESEKIGAKKFLNSARLQQKVVARGSQYWAPIYEYGSSPDGTFYVTNKYEHSLEKLIDLHAELGAKDLHAIIKQIAEGLNDLKKAYKRPHGNLKATNVFITRDSSGMKVAMSDPLPDESIDAKVHWYADLRAIGELIYQLVVHRPAPSLAGARISDSEEWAGLKRQKDEWRDLCECLLAVSIKPDAITLESLVEKLTELEKSKPVFSGRRMALGLFTIIAIVIVCLTLWYRPVSPKDREDLLKDYFSWIEPLYRELGFTHYQEDYENSINDGRAYNCILLDEDLIKIIGEDPEDPNNSKIWRAGFPAQTATNDDEIIEEIRDPSKHKEKIKNAIDAVEDIRQFFNPDKGEWPILKEIHEAADSLGENEEKWIKPAVSYFKDLVNKVKPPNKKLFEGDANNVSPKKVEIFEGVNEILKLKDSLESKKKKIADIQDEIEDLRKEVGGYANGKRIKVDKELSVIEKNEIRTSEEFENYLNEIRGFRNIENIHEGYKNEWDPNDYTRILVGNFNSMPKNKENAGNLEKELDELGTKFDGLKQKLEEEGVYYIAKNEEVINERYEELIDNLENLWDRIIEDLNDPSEWLKDVDGREITDSNVLKKKWRIKWKNLLDDDTRKKLESDKNKKERYITYTEVQPKVEDSWDRLNKLQKLGTNLSQKFEKQLRTADGQTIQIDGLSDVYKKVLEEAFGKIEYNKLLDNNSTYQMLDINEPASVEYFSGHKLVQLNLVKDSSATKLVELVRAYGDIREQFRLFYLLEDKKTGDFAEVFEYRLNKLKKDKVFSRIFDSDSKTGEAFSILESKISKIRNIKNMQLSGLRNQVDKVLKDTDDQVLYAVYVGLEKASEDPKWPKDPNEWDLEQTMKKLLHERIGTIRDKGDRAEELEKELDDIFVKRKEHFEKLKPQYCELLDPNDQNILVFAEDITLRENFEPVIGTNWEPAKFRAWDEIRQAVDKQGNWIDFFHTTDPSDKINVGWPKYIRSKIDKNVILRFIPAGNGNPEPFYMAIYEITNRQYAAVVPYQTGLIDLGARVQVKNRKVKLDWDGSTFHVDDTVWNDYPVTWVYYKGAREYASKLGAQLPTAKQHEYVWRTAPRDPQKTERPHLRGPAWRQAKIAYNELAKSNRDTRKKAPTFLSPDRKAPLPLGAMRPVDFKDEYFDNINDEGHIVKWVYNSAWPMNIIDNERRANGWGIYDLIGNVWEWCTENDKPVLCGGSCLAELNSEPLDGAFPFDTFRFDRDRDATECDVGFRIVVPAE